MTPQLWFHPLASFCHKVLIALHEKGVLFEPVLVDFADDRSVAAFRQIHPMAKMPVLVDREREAVVAETTIILEYLEQRFPDRRRLLPSDAAPALEARYWDRFYDFNVELPMQKIVVDRLRPPGQTDAWGVDEARRNLRLAYGHIERSLAGRTWALGGRFTIADCSAAPALFYANTVEPLGDEHPDASAYLRRLMLRPSYARTLREAEPFFARFPMAVKPDISILDRAGAAS